MHEVFGWALPRLNQYSHSRSYFSWLMPKKEYVLDARVKGGRRAMIMSGEYDRVFPMDIYPEFLLKSIIAFNINDMEARGIYEVAPETSLSANSSTRPRYLSSRSYVRVWMSCTRK